MMMQTQTHVQVDVMAKDLQAFAKPYFITAVVGYMFGLGATVFVMFYFKAAQPALLYLVPACLGSSLLTASVRNEVTSVLWTYSEEDTPATEEPKPAAAVSPASEGHAEDKKND